MLDFDGEGRVIGIEVLEVREPAYQWLTAHFEF